MTLDPDYEAYLRLSTKIFLERGRAEPADMLLRVAEETGEVAEAWAAYRGTNPRKGVYGDLLDVAHELADVAATALTAIVALGFDPGEMMTWHVNKVKVRYPDVWEAPEIQA